MNAISHAPFGYECPFCNFILHVKEGEEHSSSLLKNSDLITESELSLAFCSAKWWPKNPGHVLIVPKHHYENLYDISNEALADISIMTKLIACGMKAAFDCEGVSTRQHNEPAGNQDVWHYHQHVFPRWNNDQLYSEQGRFVSSEVRVPYAHRLRSVILAIRA
jgi:histidine triad (HIT) family protein